MADPFAPLKASIAEKNREGGFDASHPWHHELTVHESEGLLDVEYHGECFLWLGERPGVNLLDDLLGLLASPEVAPRFRSFTYKTDAVWAANGTYSIVID